MTTALAFLEIGDGPALLLLMLGPAVVGVAALIGSLALFAQAARVRDGGSRIGWYIGAALMLIVALGIGACYGVVFVGLRTPGW